MVHNSTLIRVEGIVEEALPGLIFRVIIKSANEAGNSESEKKEILAHPAGKLKINHIRIIPGDRVLVEMVNLNDRRGRIVRRF